jgi:hypothetical protein
MGIIAKDNGGEFEPIPLGIHRAICINVFDIGYQAGYQGAPPKHQIVVLWEIEPVQTWEPNIGKHFTVTKFYTLSINKKSNLGQDLESWRTQAFTEEEMEGFDLDKIIGKPCQLNLIPNKDKAKVAIVLPADKRTPYWEAETGRDFVPKYVETKRNESVPEPSKKGKVSAGEPFDDDLIPF